MSRDSTIFFDKKWLSKIDSKNFCWWIPLICYGSLTFEYVFLSRIVKGMRYPFTLMCEDEATLSLTGVYKCLTNDLFCVFVLTPLFGNCNNLFQICFFCFHGNCVMWVLNLHYWNYKLVLMNVNKKNQVCGAKFNDICS